MTAAYNQLLLYREDLENPPLLVVCDMDRFEVHTNFTGTLKTVHAFDLAGLAEPTNLDILRKVFTDPDALKPGLTAEVVTEQAAELIGQLADGMRVRNIPAQRAAHFLMKLMFCMFAEDIELLPGKVFSRIMDTATKGGAKGLADPGAGPRFAQLLRGLFDSMARGGLFGTDEILQFNGGLFADSDVIDLTPDEMLKLRDVSRLDWSGLEPSIFGTLFERTLDPEKRSQIGAHYTSRQDIETLLEPVVMQPLRREWEEVKAECDKLSSGLAVGQDRGGQAEEDPAARQDACGISWNGWPTLRFSTRPADRGTSCTWRCTCCWTWRRKSSPTRPGMASGCCPKSGRRNWPASRSTPTPSNWPRW